MKSISRLAVAAALAVVSISAPAVAAKKEAAPAGPKLSKPVQSLLAQAQTAQGANDHASALALLNQALAVPKATAEDKLWTYRLMLNSAQATKDNALLKTAIEGSLSTGMVTPEDEVKFRTALRGLALQAKDYQGAIQQATKMAAMKPTDANLQYELAGVYQLANQPKESYAAAAKAIDIAKAAGSVPEDYYKTAAKLALDNKMDAEFATTTSGWLASYPTPENWRTILTLFRDSANFDDQGNLDVFRLMQATGSLASEKDYYEYAETANQRGYPAEAKLALDEGLAKGKLSTSKSYTKELVNLVTPKVATDKKQLAGLEAEAKKASSGKLALSTADAYLGHGNYAKAAELYRVALSKGADAAVVNTRLGIALGKAGQKAEAEAALSAAASGTGPRAQLAKYWQIWLGRQA